MPSLNPFRRRDDAKSRGQSLVEFALVLPILLVIFAAAADFGRIFYSYVAIENAVKEGAIYGARYPLCSVSTTACIDPNNVEWRVRNETAVINQDGTVLAPTIECLDQITGLAHADMRDCVEGDRYVVQLQYRFNMITPIIGAILGDHVMLGAGSSATVLNAAFDPTPGAGPTKLVSTSQATNAAEILAACTEPDPSGSPGFYRQPCKDIDNNDHWLHFRTGVGDRITYKLIGINNGGTNLTGVTMNDSSGWPPGCAAPATMAVNDPPWECTYTIAVPPPASGVSDKFTNTFAIDSNETVAFTDTATVYTEYAPADLAVLVYVSPFQNGNDGDGLPTFGTAKTLTATHNAQVPAPSVWFQVVVENLGGQTATGLSITGTPNLPTTADCPARPSSLGPGAAYTCRYQVAFSTDSTVTATATATATNVVPDAGDTNSAKVTWAACNGATNAVVPNLIGKDKTQAASGWTGAGFKASNLTNINSGSVATQTLQAYQCLPKNTTTMTVSKSTTP